MQMFRKYQKGPITACLIIGNTFNCVGQYKQMTETSRTDSGIHVNRKTVSSSQSIETVLAGP